MTTGPLKTSLAAALIVTAAPGPFPTLTAAQAQAPPVYLKDRGTGQPTSMFGTYIRKGELLIYPFIEGYVDNDKEYQPLDLGFGLDKDFRGKYRALESLVYLGYGVTDWLAFELEASAIKASLVTSDWEYKFGGGVIKGSRSGTFTLRMAAEYSVDESSFASGEYAVEYLKRLSPSWRVYLGIEGNQDEVEFINEVQWHFNDRVFLKMNNGFGLTSKATDWAPEVGIMFSVPVGRKD